MIDFASLVSLLLRPTKAMNPDRQINIHVCLI